MRHYSKEEIQNYLHGDFAEKIFKLLHTEIGCDFWHTGHETLFPHMLHIANWNARRFVENIKKGTYKKSTDSINKIEQQFNLNNKTGGLSTHKIDPYNDLADVFKKTETGKKLSSFPDYVVVARSGRIFQMEVKYSKDGTLRKSDIQKYIDYHEGTYIMLVMAREPYITFLCQNTSFTEEGFEHFLKIIKKKNMTEKVKHMTETERKEAMKQIMQNQTKKGWHEVSHIDDNGNLFLGLDVDTKKEPLMYSRTIMTKYQNAVRDFLKGII